MPRSVFGRESSNDAGAGWVVLVATLFVGLCLLGEPRAPEAAPATLAIGGEVAQVERRGRLGGNVYQVVLRCNHGLYVLSGYDGSFAHRAWQSPGGTGLLYVAHANGTPGAETSFSRLETLPAVSRP